MARARHIISIFLLLHSSFFSYGQHLHNSDSLKRVLSEQKEDTNKVKLLYNLSFVYTAGSYADSALVYSQQALDLAEKLRYESGMFWSLITLGESLAILGNYPLSLEYNFKAFALAEKLNDPLKMCFGNGGLASCYLYMGDYKASIKYMREVLRIMDSTHVSNDKYWMWANLSKAFHGMGQSDSALLYAQKAYELVKGSQSLYSKSFIAPVLGNAYAAKANYDSALLYYKMGIPLSIKRNTQTHLIDNYYGVAKVYKLQHNWDSAVYYSQKILNEKILRTYPMGLFNAANLLADIYESKNESDSSLKYLRLALTIKDSLFNQQKIIAVQNLIYKEQDKQKEVDAIRVRFNNRLQTYGLIAGLLACMVIAIILLRNHRQRQIQQIRNNIADDLHDDIGSTLSSISIMSELAKARSPEASTLLNSISESTVSVQENMSDIVWAIKSENDSFAHVLQRMNQFAAEITESKNIELDFQSDIALNSYALTMKQRKNLYLFFKEVINNSVKHSDATKVSVSVLKKEHYVDMVIRDNGKGFDTRQTVPGNGMDSLRRRAEDLSGIFNIRSQEHEGTVAELKFKIT